MTVKLSGVSNYGKPKQDYADKISAMDETELFNETEQMIWLSAYAGNNPRSDYHWQVDACYNECTSRGRPDIYINAWKKASSS